MNDDHEELYIRGRKAAYRQILNQCLREIGEHDRDKDAWRAERAETIAVLRMVCDDHGDNDWLDDLHLADVIDKHLARHLEERADNLKDQVDKG